MLGEVGVVAVVGVGVGVVVGVMLYQAYRSVSGW